MTSSAIVRHTVARRRCSTMFAAGCVALSTATCVPPHTRSTRGAVSPFAFRATAAIRDTAGARNLEVTTTVRNRSDTTVVVEYGQCSMTVRIEPTREQSHTPVWSWAGWGTLGATEHGNVCLGYLAMTRIVSGATHEPPEFRRLIPVTAILGDSVRPGRYRVIARLTDVTGGPYELPAGEVHLRP